MLPTPTGWFPDPWNSRGCATGTAGPGPVIAAVPTAAPQPHPTLPIRAAWGAVVTLLVSLVASRYLLKAISGYDWPIAVYVAILAIVGYVPALMWCWYASRRWGTGRFRADVGFRARWVDAGWGPLTWLACLLTPDRGRAGRGRAEDPVHQQHRGRVRAAGDRGYVVSLLVLAVVAAPLAEEIVFRGVVLRGLLSRNGAVRGGRQCRACCSASPTSTRSAARGNIGLILVLGAVGCVLGGAAYPIRRLAADDDRPRDLNSVAMAIAMSAAPVGCSGALDNALVAPESGRAAGGCRSGGRRRTTPRRP